MNAPRRSNLFGPLRAIVEFVRLESASGVILFASAVLAMIFANSPWHSYYEALRGPCQWQWGGWHIALCPSYWINEALMSFFFLLVGLEIKREMYQGVLNSLSKIALPGVAAIGGMLLPALIYLVLNHGNADALWGWAIPTATDIAFALGIVALLGKRVPIELKMYLMALAIFDDIGAIIIIALFYQTDFSWIDLVSIFISFAIVSFLNRLKICALWVYGLMGILLWALFLKSGIHPTLAGILMAFAIPLKDPKDKKNFPLQRLERALHPWVAYGILPLFSFVNAGVSFKGLGADIVFNPISLGILLGLFIGKQVGVFGATWMAIRLGWAAIPKGVTWPLFYAAAVVCGVGFTMSLFIGELAFGDSGTYYPMLTRFGVFVGSCLSGTLGYLLLRLFTKREFLWKTTHTK